MNKKQQGIVFASISAILWGIMLPIIRYLAINNVSPSLISIMRLWIGSVTLFITVLLFKKKIDYRIQNKKWFFMLSLFGMTLNFILMHVGLKFTYSNSAVLLANTVPIWVLLFMVLFSKERIGLFKVFAVIISSIGVVLIFLGDTGMGNLLKYNFIGDTLELLSAIAFAFFIYGSAEFLNINQMSTINRLELLMKIFFFSAVFLTPLIFFISFKLTMPQFLIILALGIIQTAIAHGLWYSALSKISPITVSLVFNLIIVTSFAVSWSLLNENLNIFIVTGGLLIISSLFLCENIFFIKKILGLKID